MVFTVLWCAIMKPSRNHHLGVVGAAVAVLLAAIGGAPVRPFASLVRPTWLFYFNLLVPMYDITMDHLRVKPMPFYGVDGQPPRGGLAVWSELSTSLRVDATCGWKLQTRCPLHRGRSSAWLRSVGSPPACRP